MKIVILRGTMTSVGNARSGHVVDLPEVEARILLRSNRAAMFVELDVVEQIDRSIGLDTSEEVPTTRKRGRKKKVMVDDVD